jgi:AraC-like DNA-binding protein
MPVFMDIHILPGVKAEAVAEAHRLDMLIQEHHGCRCMTYWIDEERESVVCLIEASKKEDLEEMHLRAHGLTPNRIIEVDTLAVRSFLGRIEDPSNFAMDTKGLKVFNDPSYRYLLVSQIEDPVLLIHSVGRERAHELRHEMLTSTRRHLQMYNGREVECCNRDFIASFTSAQTAVECAARLIEAIRSITDVATVGYKIAIHGGEPIESSNDLFGDVIRFTDYMHYITPNQHVTISSAVKSFALKNGMDKVEHIIALAPQQEPVIQTVFDSLESNWQDPSFDIEGYCRATAMSKSQLYRKTIELTGLSPNQLLKDYRLAKAKNMMQQRKFNISQITFDSGFTSPSYFTKCFKQRYGLLPMAYIEQLS